MIGMRVAAGALGVVMLTGAVACSMSDQPANVKMSAAVVASKRPTETLKPLLEQRLPNVKGKTFTSVIVAFPPDARAKPHRHGKAFVYAYVLEGSVRSELAGKPAKTYREGQNWVEPPGAHHVLTSPRTPAGLNRPSSWSSSSRTPGTS